MQAVASSLEPSSADPTSDGRNADPPATTEKSTMQAIVHERYGRPGVLELRDVAKPVIEDDQVLVRVHASSVNPVEW